jgi:hypothetical protein
MAALSLVESAVVTEESLSKQSQSVTLRSKPIMPLMPPKASTTAASVASTKKVTYKAASLPFFSHKTFAWATEDGMEPIKRPTVVYTADSSEADDLIGCLTGDVFGFDLEWPVWRGFYKDKNGKMTSRKWLKPGKTALVQICDDKLILLIHLSKIDG